VIKNAPYNTIKFIKWGMNVGHPCTQKSLGVAIQCGDVQFVGWLLSKKMYGINSKLCCIMAAECGHLQVLKYLCER
jgi:hypothetical protein